ncbi:MAG: hypothetical protein CL943_03485 [Candidatus Diapherotrites archaeon]|uniref:Uncharacterized protein n=1 Tax=Candidatus Iainarchaeum sp. TaxID=3101447 RepID=A0A2D6M1R2_9ARCH|nr:hypothetical protein [Candidatus Diapherotrites archaeon]
MSFVPVFAQETPSDGADAADDGIDTLDTTSVTDPDVEPELVSGEEPKIVLPGTTVQRSSFICHSPDSNPEEKILDPKEVANLKQKLQVDGNGFVGKEISSGAPAKSDRDELGNPQSAIVIPTGKDGEATLKEMPTEKFTPDEMEHWLSKFIKGPFAFGLSLNDTVRIGVCKDLPEGVPCPVADKQLFFRNSGEGIVSDFKLVWKDFKDIFTDTSDFVTGEKTIPEMTKEDEDALRVNMAGEADINSLQYEAFTRPSDELIPNSIKTESFTSSMGSSCNTTDCLISSYSMFDKYYNSWFAADLVVSNFGPTLFGQAKRYLTYPSRQGWAWGIEQNALFNTFRRKFMGPDSWYGKVRARRIVQRAREYGFGEYWTKMVENADWDSGYTAIKGGGFRKWLNDGLKPGGYIDEIKDPIRRGQFFKIARDMRGYSRAQRDIINSADEVYSHAIKRFGEGSLEARNALIEYGRVNYNMADQMDNLLSLDYPEYWLRDSYAGMYPYAVKHKTSGTTVTLIGDSQHIDGIGRKFVKDGHWDDWSGLNSYQTNSDGFLQLYEADPAGRFIDTVPVEDLKKHFSRFKDKMVRTEKGDLLKVDEVTVDYIVGGVPGTGKVKVYDLKWKEGPALSPEQFASKMTHSRVKGRLANNFNDNMDRFYNQLVEKNFAGMDRRYLSVLDKSLAREEEIIKSYLSIRGGAKWTVLPYIYSGAKRGFGFGEISAFMLPENWREIEFYLGPQSIYNDAFVDFFANHGSDEGDIFRQLLNKLPWKMVYNYVFDTFEPYNRLTGRGWRPKVENVAYFTSTGDECVGCTSVLKLRSPETATSGQGDMSIDFKAEQSMDTYLLEDAISKEARKEGSTLIAFGHHTNVKGKATDTDQGEETELIEAQNEEETCRDKVTELGLGLGAIGSSAIIQENPARIGGVLAFSESISYAIFGWSGIIGSVLQQTLIAPKLQNCVDDQEGYFVHMFAPTEEEQENQENVGDKASEKATDLVKNISDTLVGEGKDDGDNSFIEVAKDKIREQTQNLDEKQRSNTILQATLQTQGTTDGELFAKELFFFWFKGETNAAKYDEQSQMNITDPNTDTNVLFDNKLGQILVNGEPVITSKDHVRLSSPNSKIPAVEIPQRIGEILMPTDVEKLLFEWDAKGRFTVSIEEVLGCIKRNVEEQTGVELRSDNITDAFGDVESIITDSHTITIDKDTGSVVATGAPRRIVSGSNARAEIFTTRKALLKNGNEAGVGLLESIQFNDGVIIYKPETHELIIWLKHHTKAVASKFDIQGLKATPTTVTNPETSCSEPAINLEALPIGGSPAIAETVGNMNDSLAKMGPFQVFDTEKHRFVFYSQLTSDGTCEDRVKIINKETGEIYDQAITGPIENTPDGIRFKTADGKEHTLDFDAEDGTPRISYNGGPPETLLTAQGPNGSFWYDPDTGRWYPENAQFLPLVDTFKQKGFNTAVGPDGRVTTGPGGNNLSVQIGSDSGAPFNLPSLPEDPLVMMLFIVSLLGVITVFRIKVERGR